MLYITSPWLIHYMAESLSQLTNMWKLLNSFHVVHYIPMTYSLYDWKFVPFDLHHPFFSLANHIPFPANQPFFSIYKLLVIFLSRFHVWVKSSHIWLFQSDLFQSHNCLNRYLFILFQVEIFYSLWLHDFVCVNVWICFCLSTCLIHLQWTHCFIHLRSCTLPLSHIRVPEVPSFILLNVTLFGEEGKERDK